MHEVSCIGINYAHMFPKCFRSLDTLLGFALYFVSSIQLLSLYPCIQFWPAHEFLIEIHTAKTGLLRCCLYTSRRLQQTFVSCKRSNCTKIENIKKKSWKSLVWGFIQRRQTTDFVVLSCRFACILIYRLSLNNYELHQESLHCHQLEEELDDWCDCWYFQNRMGLSCRSPESWCRRFNVDRFVEVRTISQWSIISRLIERDPSILFVSKIFFLRHVMGEILVRKLVHFGTDLFISIMFELGYTKFGIDQKAIVDPLITLLDASLFQIMDLMIFFLLWSFPISVVMRMFLLNHVVWNWEKVRSVLDDVSVDCTFFQQMSAEAIDNVFTPIW